MGSESPNMVGLLDSRVENGTSDVDGDVADGDVDAQLDLGVGVAVGLAGADVAGATRRLDRVQEKQMPIRQPYSGLQPGASACSSRVAPELSAATPRSRERHVPVASPGVGRPAGANSSDVQALDVRARRNCSRDGPHQPGRPAQERLGVVVPDRRPRRHGVEVLATEEAGRSPPPLVGVGEDESHVRVLLGDGRQLVAVCTRRHRVGVVQEHDLARCALVAQRAQHRQHRRDAAAAADEQHLARARASGSGERAVGLREADHEAGRRRSRAGTATPGRRDAP